jgi:hypothetical protein
MNNEQGTRSNRTSGSGKKVETKLHTLIALEDFKALLGVDDREETLARFCLTTATYTIEQYCKRLFMRKKYFEQIDYTGDSFMPLREYPVISMSNEKLEIRTSSGLFQGRDLMGANAPGRVSNGEMFDLELYRVIPDCGTNMDIPYSIELLPTVKKWCGLKYLKVAYWAGYTPGNVPADLASACMELASWNMNRYKGRRIGMTGNIRGGGKDGEHFEMSMPENVRSLLEPYRRKTI